jgi:hypothetical protein
MVLRIFGSIFGAAAAVVLVWLGVVNRHMVDLKLDPFDPEKPVWSIPAPLSLLLLATLILGVVVGGVATWMSQGKWRRIARNRTQEAMRWKGEAERLTRERDQRVGERPASAAAGGGGRQLAIAKR